MSNNFEETLKQFESELKALMDKYHVKMDADIDFPRYRQLPVEVQLALHVLETHGAAKVITFTEATPTVTPQGEPNGNV